MKHNFPHLPPAWLTCVKSVPEKVVEEEVVQFRVFVVGCFDVAQENRSDDTTASPHQSDPPIVQGPSELLGCLSEEHEALQRVNFPMKSLHFFSSIRKNLRALRSIYLSVWDDLWCVEGLSDCLYEFFFVPRVGRPSVGTLQNLAGLHSLILDWREAPGKIQITVSAATTGL